MPTSTAREQKLFLELFRNQAKWPMWPVMPLKRHPANTDPSPESFPWELGFILAGEEGSTGTKVYLAPNSLFADVTRYTELQTVQYASYEAILADGWIID